VGTEPVDYCRQVETYLCRKNDGHLIRVVGPSFELVSRWEADGVPLKIAFQGIDRYFERYYRKGARRRPVRVDFCDADVRDVFDEWRRAVGLTAAAAGEPDSGSESPHQRSKSLPAHLERALVRLTAIRANGALNADADDILDRVSAELDAARSAAGGLRGEARRAMVARLAALDRELLQLVRATLHAEALRTLERDADEELAPFRDRMTDPVYTRARGAALDNLIRSRLSLPTLSYE
jgi:hypothetical protein